MVPRGGSSEGVWNAPLLAILVANIALHLIGIGDPIAGHHAWRQADTAAIARNYLEIDSNFFRPRIDYLGNVDGVTGSELPLYSYLCFLGYLVFDESLVWARSLSIAASCVALVAIAAIGSAWMGRRVGLGAAFFLASSPIAFHYSRSIQPDVLMIACALAGMAAWLRWQRAPGVGWLAAAIAASAVAAAIKPYATMVVAPMALGIAARDRRFATGTASLLAITIAATLAWYVYAYRLTMEHEGFRYFGGFLYDLARHPIAAAWAGATSWRFWGAVVVRGARKLFLGYVGAGFLVIGVATLNRAPRAARFYLLGWITLGLVWLVLVGETAIVHEYYALPLIPALALVAAIGLDGVWSTGSRTIRAVTIVALAFAPVLPLRHSLALRSGNVAPALVNVGTKLDAIVARDARIVIGPDASPVVALYHAHRRGWTYPTVVTPDTLGDFIARGASVLVSADPNFERQAVVQPYLRRRLAEFGAVHVFELATGLPKKSDLPK